MRSFFGNVGVLVRAYCYLRTHGPDGLKLIKEAIDAKPGPAAVFDNTSEPKRAKEFLKKLIPPGNPNAGVFGPGFSEIAAMGGMKVTVDGGERLKVRATFNVGSAIFFGLGTFAAEARRPSIRSTRRSTAHSSRASRGCRAR